ncbi:hypothetical protein FRC00_013046 [Tulasnella sp. 408]|nr:hypothetical protein FRC00_013046 [Tulasnella sp. 408]
MGCCANRVIQRRVEGLADKDTYIRIIRVLIESGAIYTATIFVFFVFVVAGLPGAYRFVDYLVTVAVAIAPTLIVLQLNYARKTDGNEAGLHSTAIEFHTPSVHGDDYDDDRSSYRVSSIFDVNFTDLPDTPATSRVHAQLDRSVHDQSPNRYGAQNPFGPTVELVHGHDVEPPGQQAEQVADAEGFEFAVEHEHTADAAPDVQLDPEDAVRGACGRDGERGVVVADDGGVLLPSAAAAACECWSWRRRVGVSCGALGEWRALDVGLGGIEVADERRVPPPSVAGGSCCRRAARVQAARSEGVDRGGREQGGQRSVRRERWNREFVFDPRQRQHDRLEQRRTQHGRGGGAVAAFTEPAHASAEHEPHPASLRRALPTVRILAARRRCCYRIRRRSCEDSNALVARCGNSPGTRVAHEGSGGQAVPVVVG